MIYFFSKNIDQSQSNELIRRSGGSTATLHHHCPPDSTSKIRTVKRDMNQKLARKDYEIKTLKNVIIWKKLKIFQNKISIFIFL